MRLAVVFDYDYVLGFEGVDPNFDTLMINLESTSGRSCSKKMEEWRLSKSLSTAQKAFTDERVQG